jgi:hypothetical protein
VDCFTKGDIWACGGLVMNLVPWGKVGKVLEAGYKALRATVTMVKIIEKAQGLLRRVEKITAAAQEIAAKAMQKLGKPAPDCNSFMPGTKVLLADGSQKPIDQVKVGDQVQTTDPKTGEFSAQPVVGTIIGQGQKRLVEITVNTDGATDGSTGTVTATDGHPFWLPKQQTWTRADQLEVGSMLQTAAGTWVQVTAVRKWTAHERVHNLTVAKDHTYYVVAGGSSVFVHNCGTGPKDGKGLSPDDLMSRAEELRDQYAGEMAGLSQSKRPATVTAGYNVETGQYAAGASVKGVCAEVCVVNQLGGDASKVVFTSAVRPRTGAQINICVSCEAQFGRAAFQGKGTIFDTDVLRTFD